MMRVASGLDSMVIGEPQILGQMKQAYTKAAQAGTLGKQLSRLFQSTFTVAKKVRSDTSIGHSPVSIASAAVKLAGHIFSHIETSRVLLIGAGQTIELAARYLKGQGVKTLIFANRTQATARQLACDYQGEAIALEQIPTILPQADITIAATNSTLPLLGKGSVERALKQRKHKPMLMIDLAVPRNIEAEIGQLADIYLYTVDDLQQVVVDNNRARRDAAVEAEHIINYHAQKFMGWARSIEEEGIIRDYRSQSEKIRDDEVAKVAQLLQKGLSPEEALARLAYSLTQKLLHQPTVQMRKDAMAGRQTALEYARDLLFSSDNNL